MSGRGELWAGLPPERHMALVGAALDVNDLDHQRMAGEVRASFIEVRLEMREGFKECEDRDKASRKLLVTLLVSIVLSSVGIMFTVLAAGLGS